MTLRPQLVARLAVSTGVVTTVACAVIGYLAYRASAHRLKQTIAGGNLALARRVSAQISGEQSKGSPSELRQDVAAAWNAARPQFEGSYLCVIEKPGVITVHTKVDKAVGKDVRSVSLPGAEMANVGGLLSSDSEWAGANTSARGIPQLVGYARLDSLDGLVVVHTPMKLVESDIRNASVPWAIGLCVVAFVLTPVSIALLYSAFRRASDQARKRGEREQELEVRLLQKQKMEALGLLAGGIAHDFNNLLVVMQLNAELARVKVDDQDIDNHMEEIIQATTRAERMTRQLLTFTRDRAGVCQPIDLCQSLTEIAGLLRRLVREDIRLDCVPGGEGLYVLGDPGFFDQIILNLVANAQDAMPDGGRITVALRSLDEDNDDRGGKVCLEVADTGSGIAVQDQARVFEPFYSSKSSERSAGLGLATVHGLVTQMNGEVEIRSAEGEGATFRIILPTTTARPEEPKSVETVTEESVIVPDTHGRRPHILVCEDEADARESIGQILEQAGYEPILASTGSEALSLARRFEGKLSLLLTDVRLPDIPGHIMADEVLAMNPRLRVLFVSGFVSAGFSERRERSEGLLRKPFSRTELLVRIARAIDDAHRLTAVAD